MLFTLNCEQHFFCYFIHNIILNAPKSCPCYLFIAHEVLTNHIFFIFPDLFSSFIRYFLNITYLQIFQDKSEDALTKHIKN